VILLIRTREGRETVEVEGIYNALSKWASILRQQGENIPILQIAIYCIDYSLSLKLLHHIKKSELRTCMGNLLSQTGQIFFL